jgi:hypothetical protein
MFTNTEALMYQNLKKEMKEERKDSIHNGRVNPTRF